MSLARFAFKACAFNHSPSLHLESITCGGQTQTIAHASIVRAFCSITFPFSGLQSDEDVGSPGLC